MFRAFKTQITFQFFKNIHEAGRNIDPRPYRERKAMRLTRAMIGILSQNHDLYVFKWSVVQSREKFAALGENGPLLGFFSAQELPQVLHVAFAELGQQAFFPRGFELNLFRHNNHQLIATRQLGQGLVQLSK